ncbi:hypothetical protein ZWY2020_021846 [Hordeum vulgare]|nr:hypothetical protein ZWY2020_021846 [Hordeum vulgare]
MCASADRSSDAVVLNMSARALQLKVTWRPASRSPAAKWSMQLMWPCAGHGNTSTCAAMSSDSGVAPPAPARARLRYLVYPARAQAVTQLGFSSSFFQSTISFFLVSIHFLFSFSISLFFIWFSYFFSYLVFLFLFLFLMFL